MMQGWFIVYQSCCTQLLQILILLMNFECVIVIIIFKVNTQSRMLNLCKMLYIFNALFQVGDSINKNG
jgi:hypothetical protein